LVTFSGLEADAAVQAERVGVLVGVATHHNGNIPGATEANGVK
jgi:hypothetical protein